MRHLGSVTAVALFAAGCSLLVNFDVPQPCDAAGQCLPGFKCLDGGPDLGMVCLDAGLVDAGASDGGKADGGDGGK
jgi:hypothetical protein